MEQCGRKVELTSSDWESPKTFLGGRDAEQYGEGRVAGSIWKGTDHNRASHVWMAVIR